MGFPLSLLLRLLNETTKAKIAPIKAMLTAVKPRLRQPNNVTGEIVTPQNSSNGIIERRTDLIVLCI